MAAIDALNFTQKVRNLLPGSKNLWHKRLGHINQKVLKTNWLWWIHMTTRRYVMSACFQRWNRVKSITRYQQRDTQIRYLSLVQSDLLGPTAESFFQQEVFHHLLGHKDKVARSRNAYENVRRMWCVCQIQEARRAIDEKINQKIPYRQREEIHRNIQAWQKTWHRLWDHGTLCSQASWCSWKIQSDAT